MRKVNRDVGQSPLDSSRPPPAQAATASLKHIVLRTLRGPGPGDSLLNFQLCLYIFYDSLNKFYPLVHYLTKCHFSAFLI